MTRRPFTDEDQRRHLDQVVAAFERVSGLTPLQELTELIPIPRYTLISETQALDELIDDDTQVVVTAGAFYGDEAKGKWGNVLSQRVDLVVRANSGANTGRTIYHLGEEIVFHVVPAAVVKGIECLIGSEVAADPISMLREELLPLVEKGIGYDNLKVGNLHVTTPAHRIMDVLSGKLNGSTKVGIKYTHAGMKLKTNVRLDDIFNSPENLKERLRVDFRAQYQGFLRTHRLTRANVVEHLEEIQQENSRVVPDHVLDFARVHAENGIDAALDHLVELYTTEVRNNEAFPERCDVQHRVQEVLGEGKRIGVEVTQGHRITNNIPSVHPCATSADTTVMGALNAVGINPIRYKTVAVNAHKAPGSSRVGRGNIPSSFTAQNRFAAAGITKMDQLGTACSDFQGVHGTYFSQALQGNGLIKPVIFTDDTGKYEIGDAMAITTSRTHKEQGATTKKPRITGWLDLVALRETMLDQGPNLCISAMDRGDLYEKLGLVVGYVVSLPEDSSAISKDAEGAFIDCQGTKYRTGHVVKIGDAVPSQDVLHHCLPIVREVNGWKDTPIIGLNHSDELPLAVQEFVGLVEHYTGAKIIGLGIGPKDHQALYLRKEAV